MSDPSILMEDGFYLLNEYDDPSTGGHFLQEVASPITIVLLSDGKLAIRITDTFFLRL